MVGVIGAGAVADHRAWHVPALREALGLPLLEQPDLLLQPEPAVLSAAWFWQFNGLNALADAGDLKASPAESMAG